MQSQFSCCDCSAMGTSPNGALTVRNVGSGLSGKLSNRSAKTAPSYRIKRVSEHAQEKFGATAKNYVHFKCHQCGHEFDLPEDKAARMAQAAEVLCFQCFDEQRQREQETGDTVTCSDCNGTFLFSIAEDKFYKTKGLGRPKRCPTCWQKRKTGPSPNLASAKLAR